RIALVFAFHPSWQCDLLAFYLDVHGRVAEREEVPTWPHSWEPRFFSILYSTKEGFHGPIQAEIHLLQKLAVDPFQLRIVLLALLQGPLSFFPSRPLLTVTKLHDPPVVQAPALSLHKFQG